RSPGKGRPHFGPRRPTRRARECASGWQLHVERARSVRGRRLPARPVFGGVGHRRRTQDCLRGRRVPDGPHGARDGQPRRPPFPPLTPAALPRPHLAPERRAVVEWSWSRLDSPRTKRSSCGGTWRTLWEQERSYNPPDRGRGVCDIRIVAKRVRKSSRPVLGRSSRPRDRVVSGPEIKMSYAQVGRDTLAAIAEELQAAAAEGLTAPERVRAFARAAS